MHQMTSRFATFAATTLLASSLVLLSACGGGSNSITATDTSVKTGVFIDAPVKGLAYKTPTQSGVTNEKGEFKFIAGETVTFIIDGVEIGSTQAQTRVLVTAISQGNIHIAQLLQTLDTDVNPDLIDVSKIKLDTSVKNDLTALIANGGECRNIKCIETILNAPTLTTIQTNSQVALVHQSVVSEDAASHHVYQSAGSIPWQSSDVSGKVFTTVKGGYTELAVVKTDGTFSIYSEDRSVPYNNVIIAPGVTAPIISSPIPSTTTGNTSSTFSDSEPESMGGTWQLNNGELLFTFTAGESTQYKLHKLSQDDNTLDFMAENTDGSGEASLVQWHPAKPLTLAALEGKHFADDTSDETECSARTFTFAHPNLIIRERCGGEFSEYTLSASETPGVSNLIQATFGTTKTLYFALAGGDINSTFKGVFAQLENGVIDDVETSTWTGVSTPLQP